MLIKRPIYNPQLQCVAYEMLAHKEMAQEELALNPLFDHIRTNNSQLPLFIPYEFKSILDQLDSPLTNPIILKLQAQDIETRFSLDEVRDSLFSIALVVNNPQQLAWLNFADYIGITEQLMTTADVRKVVQFSKTKQRKVIAYNLVGPSSFDQCKNMTMDYYCGDFLFQPTENDQIEIAASKLNLLQLIQLLQNEDCNIDEISDIVQTDPLLSYQLLKVANSAAFAGYQPVESIAQAISRLGLAHLKSWVMILSMKNISDKPVEVLESGLIRAHMAEKIAQQRSDIHTQSAYTAGLLSIIDCLLNKPMTTVMEQISLSDEIKEALVAKKGPLGEILSLVVAYEEGHWDNIPSQDYARLDLSKLYIESLDLVSKRQDALRV